MRDQLMSDLLKKNREICVIGRIDFTTGIGAVCFAACELFSRYFPTALYPINSGIIDGRFITLPNGRDIPICRDLNDQKVFFYTDVLWNGEHDLNFTLLPDHGFRIAHVAYDSDVLPSRWVEILNKKFDCVYFTSQHLEKIAIDCGVKIPIGTLPVGLDIDSLLPRKYTKNKNVIRFGSLAAFHQRKGVDVLVDSFIKEFGSQSDVELMIHSNLAMGDVYQSILKKVNDLEFQNIKISHSNISDSEKSNLLESFDVFVNLSRGEGYSIGAREAMALGKCLLLSEVGPHNDLLDVRGTFGVPASIRLPARYPEIDKQIFGCQYGVTVADTRIALSKAYQYVKDGEDTASAFFRKQRASEFSFSKLGLNYAEALTPDITLFKKLNKRSRFANISNRCKEIARVKTGSYGSKFSAKNRHVIPVHDGGFFSVFNTFMSHLVWDLYEDKCHMVLPDWDVGRLLKRQGNNKLFSFCYGKPNDGNIWLKLFEPLYGLTETEMNSVEFLYSKSSLPETVHNEHREPSLTYVYAYDLYKSPAFSSFRKQYNAVFLEHIKLKKVYKDEIDAFCKSNLNRKFNIAAHVKHPSHIIEQPGMCIAHAQSFIDAINNKIQESGLSLTSDDWGVFLATDQDRVVAQFQEAFGPRVSFFEDVRRTRISEDDIYDALSDSDKAKEGHQVQHLVAANPDNWSSRMACEVIRDAVVMSRCNVLYHVVSNVSTAVSYFNPDIEMFFIT